MNEREEAFVTAAGLLDEAGVTWWLSDGAALGCVREGSFLESDGDIDLGCWAQDLPRVRDVLTPLGKLGRDRSGQVQIRRSGIKLDIHGHTRRGDRVGFPLGKVGQYRYVFPAYLFETFEAWTFYERTVRVPSPHGEYLTAHYGADWRIPQKQWRWDRDPPCLERVNR